MVSLLNRVVEFLDAWLWMGWDFQEIPCGFPVHVVAFKPCPSVSIQVFKFNYSFLFGDFWRFYFFGYVNEKD